MNTLGTTPAGRNFLADLEAYLQEYGQRGDKWSMYYPSWIEDPAPVINNLRDYMSQPGRDLAAEMHTLAARREARIVEARAQLQGYPQPVVQQFEFLLKAAQEGTVLSEDHGFWIDFRCTHQVRRVFLDFGRRLAEAGAIEQRDDIFFLSLDELRETARSLPELDRRQLIAARKAERAHFAAVAAPPALGTPPPGRSSDDPGERSMMKFFGGPPKPSTKPGVFLGYPGSPGVAQGVARVVRSLAEAAKVQPGDILVAETTAPPWTPLFATVAAVVTDTGGVLSHCAVVAREYGIPAVVGAGMASSMIKDGQRLEVDGSAGVVRLLS
jgi:pyruvate,water dikinase